MPENPRPQELQSGRYGWKEVTLPPRCCQDLLLDCLTVLCIHWKLRWTNAEARAKCTSTILGASFTYAISFWYTQQLLQDKAVEGQVLCLVSSSSLIKGRIFCELAFLYTISSIAWMSVEIWLATGNERQARSQDTFGNTWCPYCNQMKHAAERCPCNYNIFKPGSRHTAHGPCT